MKSKRKVLARGPRAGAKKNSKGCKAKRAQKLPKRVSGSSGSGSRCDSGNLPKLADGVELRDYQTAFYHTALQRIDSGEGVLLADEMGLGKTIQVLAVLSNLCGSNPDHPCVVAVPKSMVAGWEDEAAKFVPHLKVTTVFNQDDVAVLEAALVGEKEKRHINIILTTHGTLTGHVSTFTDICKKRNKGLKK